MISVSEAKELISENCTNQNIKSITIDEAYGFVLAEAVYAVTDTPPFDNSAMDGYAFAFDEWKNQTLKIIGEVQAGSYFNRPVNAGCAVRIFTGSALPAGTDTVVMQEKTVVTDQQLLIQDEQIFKGMNVRKQGSQSKNGDAIMQSGQLLTPAAISFIASCGIAKVSVYSHPSVSIIVTGKELIKPGNALEPGKIYESNSVTLIAALKQLGLTPSAVIVVDDNEVEIETAINSQLQSDFILLTGGVSVGDYDFVVTALERNKVQTIFHKIKQKPGKPLYFGKIGKTIVFGLPGNPASVLTCFYQYVIPAISSFTHKGYIKQIQSTLANDYSKKAGLTHFVKGKTNDKGVTILKGQESYMMHTYSVADCLVELPEEKTEFIEGDTLLIYLIN